MPASSLVGMAQRACVRNLQGIEDMADLPYEVVRPILKRITDPTALKKIEDNSPQIADADAELWRDFIKRDIPKWEEKIITPSNPRSWWKVYRKLIKEEKTAKEEQEAKLMQSLGGLAQQREANQAKIIHSVIPLKNRGQTFGNGVANPRASGWGGGSRPTTVLGALKKQSAAASQQRNSVKVQQPARALLQSAKNQIRQAPKAMVMDHQKIVPNAALQAQARQHRQDSPPPNLPPRIFAPKSGLSATDKAVNNAIRAEQADKEKRLRALTGARPRAAASPTASCPTDAMSPISEHGSRSMGLAARAGEKRKLSPSPGPAMMKKAKKVDPFMAQKRRPG